VTLGSLVCDFGRCGFASQTSGQGFIIRPQVPDSGRQPVFVAPACPRPRFNYFPSCLSMLPSLPKAKGLNKRREAR